MTNDQLDTKQKEKLQTLLGSWTGKMSTWFEPGDPISVEENTGTFKAGVNENFVVYEYASSMQGNAFKGMAIFGYNPAKQQFQSSWIDSFHMDGAIMFSEGEITENGFSILGSYTYENVKHGWRTQLEIISADEIVLTAFNISFGEETKATETRYTRSS
jgi:hypothetical protein